MDSERAHPVSGSRPSAWGTPLAILWTTFWSSNSTSMSLQPRDGLLSILPFWGCVAIVKSLDPRSGEQNAYVGRVRWLWKTKDATVQQLGPVASTETAVLVRQVHSMLKLRHPHVQVIFGTCELKANSFVVAQHFSTTILAHFRSSPTIDRRVDVLKVVDGLRFLHEHGIVHGDLHGDNVVVSTAGYPVITGYSSHATDTSTSTAEPPFTWEDADGSDSDSDEEAEEPAPPDDTDVPYERLCEPSFGPGPDPREVTLDGVIDDLIKSQVRAKLRSTDLAGDIFALGFLIVQFFTDLGPEGSPSALRVLRMVLKGQRPPHPGLAAELRGLDQKHWDTCLRCWNTSTVARPSTQEIFDVLTQSAKNAIRPPFEWSVEDLEAWVLKHTVDLTPAVRNIHEVKAGRDAEVCGQQDDRQHELQGTWVQGGATSLVKVIRPEFCRRRTLRHEGEWLAETFMWSQLHHDNILPLLGTLRIKNVDCFVVPWMAGGTAMDWARANKEATRLPIFIQVADALHWLHTRAPPIIHANIRARSIWIGDGDHAYVGNFDFQKVHDPERGFDVSGIDTAMRWMAPELALSEHTTRTDVFGFAMFAYEMLSMRRPFHKIEEYSGKVHEAYVNGHRPKRP
ncbi:kinase-like protein, partial [Auricularia subglabra TFB-10046 SS5]